jgi:maleylpyruvate isomerase
VTVDPLGLSAEVDRANDRLYETVEGLDDAAIAGASLLPGWTRGHVLIHAARNADSLVNLLTWARTGVETPQYPSPAQRDADIAAGAGRPAAEQLADLRAAGDRFAAAATALPPAAWSAMIRYGSGIAAPAAHVVWARLREVEVHHVDLDAGYGPADWSDAFTLRLLHEVAGNFAATGPPLRLAATDLDFAASTGASPGPAAGAGTASDVISVRGPARVLAAWLIGRSAGDGLTTDPADPLPPVPRWK